MKNQIIRCYWLIIFNLLLLSNTHSQQLSVNWSQRFGFNDWDYVNDMIQLDNGNYLLAGSIRNLTQNAITKLNENNGWLTAVDSNGVVCWQKFITGNGFKTITSIASTQDRIYLAGIFQDTITYDSIVLVADSYMSGFELITNLTGDLLYLNRIGNKAIINNVVTSSCVDKTIIGIEYSDSLYLNNTYFIPKNYSSIVVTEVGFNGQFSNNYKLDCSGELKLTDIESNDTSFFISGTFSDTLFISDSVFVSSYDLDSFIGKLSKQGHLIWYKQIRGRGNQEIKDLCVVGNLMGITGNIENNSFFDSIVVQSYGSNDLFIALMDEKGDFIWVKGIGSISEDRGYTVMIKKDHLYVSGSYTHIIGIPDANGNLIQYASFSPFGNSFIAKYDFHGTLKASYNLPGTSEDYCQKLIITDSGKITATGNFYGALNLSSSGSTGLLISKGSKDIFLIHFDDRCKDFLVDAGADTVKCANQNIILSSPSLYLSYLWQPGGIENNDIQISTPGIYTLTGINQYGCISKDSINVYEHQGVEVFAGNDTIVEAGLTLELIQAHGNADYWQWSTNGTGYFGNNQSLNTYYSFSNNDIGMSEITLKLSGTNICGSAVDSLIVTIPFEEDGVLVHPNPTQGQTTVICKEGQAIESITIATQSGLELISNGNVNSNTFSYDLSGYPPGTFIYYIITNHGLITKIVNKI
jgi:hypothetical protein